MGCKHTCWMSVAIFLFFVVGAFSPCGAAVKVSEAFGYDPKDSTRFLQAALDSPHGEIIVDAKDSPWVSMPLMGRSGKTIIFEDGAWIRAKRGEFKGLHDVLIRFVNCTNVTIRGGNPKTCGFRMWRDDYDDKSQYDHSQWRHAISLQGCENVMLQGISASESGGDGLYMSSGAGRGGENKSCSNLRIRTCIFDRNYRQGISVIDVDGLLVEDTELTNTKGTPPQSGIDFEPNRKNQTLRGIVMRRCLVSGNEGKGLDISHCNSGSITEPIDMLFEDCRVIGNGSGFVYGNGVNDQDVFSECGDVTVRNCIFSNLRTHGIHIYKHFNSGGRVMFEDCTLENCWTTDPEKPDIHLSVVGHDQGRPDVVVFRNVTVRQCRERPVLAHTEKKTPYNGRPTVIDGEVRRIFDGRETVFRYDADWRSRMFPFRDVKAPPPLPRAVAPLVDVEVVDDAPDAMLSCSALFVRGVGRYVFHAAKAGSVRFRFIQTLIGKTGYDGAGKMAISFHDTGKELVRLEPPRVPEGGEVSCCVPKAGFYDMTFKTGGNGVAMIGATVPVALDATDDIVAFVGPGQMPERMTYCNATNRVWIWVGAGERLECVAIGSDVETVALEMFDPDGRSVACVPAVDGVARIQPESRRGLWSLGLSKPAEGIYEDYLVSVRGVPGWMFTTKGRYWRRANRFAP